MTSPASDDLLRRAARALHDEADLDPPDAVDVEVEVWQAMHGWRDVSRTVRQAARRRRVALIVGLQLVTALAGVGAWAAVSGRLPALFSRPAPAAPPTAPAPSTRAHSARARRAAASPPAPSADAPTETPAPEPPPAPPEAPAPPAPPTPVPARATTPVKQPHRPAPQPPAPAPAPATAADREDLYRQAHQAHFVRRDHAAALVLWESYLATGGSLALEARYNRAIALVHLGRREAAIAALTPFAGGEHDGYRQEEAQALLRMLGAAPP